MADEDEASLERELTCSVCMELYEDPLELPCLHSFCRACLQDILDSQEGDDLRCPDCREEVTLGPAKMAALKKNFKLSNIVESFRKLDSKSQFPPSDSQGERLDDTPDDDVLEDRPKHPAAPDEPLRIRLKSRKYSASRKARRRERRREGGFVPFTSTSDAAFATGSPTQPPLLILPSCGYLHPPEPHLPHLCVHPMVTLTSAPSATPSRALSRRGGSADVISYECREFYVHPVAGSREAEDPHAEQLWQEESLWRRWLLVALGGILLLVLRLVDSVTKASRHGRGHQY